MTQLFLRPFVWILTILIYTFFYADVFDADVFDLVLPGLGVGDQVLGIGLNDDEDDASSDFYSSEKFSIVWRTGVTSSDLSGKTWKKITAPIISGTSGEMCNAQYCQSMICTRARIK